jgi:DNA integrity scanning protein DisA with diadenylate cyclase activity
VISLDAAEEAQRLSTQATLMEPTVLTPAMVEAVTSIDGAVLLDVGGRCHAIGVILDGDVSPLGTRARGARYNSAVRYVQSHRGRALAIVVSEDGTVDIRPYVNDPNDLRDGPE